MHLDPSGVMLWLRVTARTSAVLLAASFASPALRQLWLSALTQRMAANRHRFTLLFALSHTVHLAGVAMLASLTPDQFFSKRGLLVLVPGSLAYALIYYLAWMAFTRQKSPDLPDSKMQTFAAYVLWAVFTLAFTTGLKRNAWIYAPLALMMWLALAVRLRAKLALKTSGQVSLANR
jgi:methionine sulfoxide reductase heme-binding subunit